MGSRNAFASQSNGHSDLCNHEHEHEEQARSPKRVRLSDDVMPVFQGLETQVGTSLEVDHMILDYAAYNTIKSCLDSRTSGKQQDQSQSLSSNIAISDAFLSIFRARHQAYRPDSDLRFRILLLRLATLFTQRLTSNPTTPPRTALAELRISNTDRARSWIDSADRMPSLSLNTAAFDNDLPIALQELDRNRAHVLNILDIPAEDDQYEDAFYGTSSCISLLDLLPLFMEVLAARNAIMDSNLTEQLMELVCEFMTQACLEQYLVYGAHGTDAIDEAFAWGYKPTDDEHVNSDIHSDGTRTGKEINDMFEDEDYYVEVADWADMKQNQQTQLAPHVEDRASNALEGEDRSIATHLEQVALDHPIEGFETSILGFLEAMSISIPEPVLIQLENGQMDGMSVEETKSFLADCGVATARFFETPIGFKG